MPTKFQAKIALDTGTTSCHYSKHTEAKFKHFVSGVRIVTAGNTVVLNQIWEHPVFGEGFYNPRAPYDLISWSAVNRRFIVTLNANEDTFHLEPKDPTRRARWTAVFQDKLFFLSPAATSPAAAPSATVVALAAATHPARDVRVWQFHERMAHAPTEALVYMAAQPEHRRLRLTAKKIRAQKLEDCPCCIRGKTSARTPRGSTLLAPDQPKPQVGATVHMDLASFTLGKGHSFVLVAKEASTGFFFTKLLERKTKEQVLTAVLEIRGYLMSKTLTLSSLHCDSEEVFKSLALPLRKLGVNMVFVPPGVHERVSERAIRTLKDWLRTNLAALDYDLPPSLFRFLLAHVTRMLNDTPNSRSGKVSPRAVIDPSHKTSAKLASPGIPFGAKALAHFLPDNNMQSHMRPVLYLGHASTSGHAGFQCLDLKSRRLITANKIKPHGEGNSPAEDMRRLFAEPLPILLDASPVPVQAQPTGATPVIAPPPLTPSGSPSSAPSASPPHTDVLEQASLIPLPDSNEHTPETSPSHHPLPSTPPLPVLTSDTSQDQEEPLAPQPGPPHEQQATALPLPSHRLNRFGRRVYSYELARAIQQGGPKRKQTTEHVQVATEMRDAQVAVDHREVALHKEVAKFIEAQALVPVSHTRGEILPTHSFGKAIIDANGTTVAYKERIVVGGNKQKYGIPEDVGANTPGIELMLSLIQLAISLRYSITTLDVTSAFLHSTMPRPLHVRLEKRISKAFCAQDPRFVDFLQPNGTIIAKLNKAVYGLKEGPLEFQKYTTEKLAQQGFHPCESARCLYSKRLGDGRFHYLLCYVDDFLSIAPPENHNTDFMAKCFTNYTVNRGPELEYLSIKIEVKENHVFVSQPGYAAKIVEEAGAGALEPSSLPYQANLFDPTPDSPPLEPAEAKLFVKVAMMINYLATRTRPDLKLATAFLTTRLRDPTRADFAKLMKVARYLKGTQAMGLTFYPAPTTLSCQADASHGLHRDARGQLGFCIWLGSRNSAPIMTLCKRADAAATSSTHAEALALYRAALDLVPLIWLLEQLGLKQSAPVIVGQDNQSLTRIVERGSGWGGKSRHFELKFWWLQDCLNSGLLKLQYVMSEDQIPDGFTKPLEAKRFLPWRDSVLGKPYREYASYQNALLGKCSS